MTVLRIQNFAQIRHVDLAFGDLTVLVGAQGTGKSLALQWLKTALDGRQIVSALLQAGQTEADKPDVLIDQIFGVGMGAAWSASTVVSWDGEVIEPKNIAKRGIGTERVFYIPAHRSMLISDGWALPFQKLTVDTPVVARLFSQNLFERFTSRSSKGDTLFPLDRVLKQQYRELIDQAVFHGGTIGIAEDKYTKRLKLTHGKSQLPFMTWTAGQREFTPLLLGLYHLFPPGRVKKSKEVDWLIIEEPEMGLHPQAVMVFMLLVLELLWRGYRVVLSTHSPQVLTVLWMLRRLRENGARWQLLCEAFGIAKPRADLESVATAALKKDVLVHLLSFGPDGDGKVSSTDISSLDPGSDDDSVSGWGGLTGFASRCAEIVRQSVLERPVVS
jgi:hypothetical protein